MVLEYVITRNAVNRQSFHVVGLDSNGSVVSQNEDIYSFEDAVEFCEYQNSLLNDQEYCLS